MFFWIIFLYQIIWPPVPPAPPAPPVPPVPPAPPAPPEPQLKYKFKFKKRGLQGNEFEDCLTSKVDKLLTRVNVDGIKTLKGNVIKAVRRDVFYRENLSNSHLDKRSPRAINNATQRGVLRNNDDTPMKHKRVQVGRGEQNYNNFLWQTYHEIQHDLFANHLLRIDELSYLLHGINVNPDENRKGYLIRADGVELSSIEFCDVIDEISIFFLQKLGGLSPKQRVIFSNQWGKTLESVYGYCLDILVYRNAMDWSTDNDLMSRNYNVWKDHVMVMISFSALMAVTEMLRKKQKKLASRKNWFSIFGKFRYPIGFILVLAFSYLFQAGYDLYVTFKNFAFSCFLNQGYP